jgi:hypothetical protein
MEADAVRKTLIYFAAAVVLGLAFMLVPLITLAETMTQDHPSFPESLGMLPDSLRKLAEVESPPRDRPRSSTFDVEVLGVSFIVALIAYVLFKRRLPERKYRMIGQIPF